MPIPRLFKSLVSRTLSVAQIPGNRLDQDLKIERQATGLWCWASVGVGVSRYYRDRIQETQCSRATKVKMASQGCCDSSTWEPVACIEPHRTEEVLEKAGTGHLSARQPPAAFFDAVVEEYGAEKPLVCAMKGWQVNGQDVASHVLIVRGSRKANDLEYVCYMDPAGPIIDCLSLGSFAGKLDRFILTD